MCDIQRQIRIRIAVFASLWLFVLATCVTSTEQARPNDLKVQTRIAFGAQNITNGIIINNAMHPDSSLVASSATSVLSGSVSNSNNQTQSSQLKTIYNNENNIRARSNSSGVRSETRVPFWNIAHMINSIAQVELALKSGANGIETDVSFDARGNPIEAYHGFPCDCGRHCHYREEFKSFVKYVGSVNGPAQSRRLMLILFDLKLKDLKNDEQRRHAGTQLAFMLHENIYGPYERIWRQHNQQASPRSKRVHTSPNVSLFEPPIRAIISINHASDIALVKALLTYLRERRLDFMSQYVGFDIGMNDNLTDILKAWDTLKGVTFNIWQGDGLTNCANIVRGIERLKDAVSIRNDQGHFRKIYYWTADISYHIRNVLRIGIDAILTNKPQRVLQVLGESEFKQRYRLATAYDNPYEQFWIQPTAWKMSPPTLKEAAETALNIRETSLGFIKTMPNGISAAIKKVQSTIMAAIR